MAKLVLLPGADAIESGTYLLYDGACGAFSDPSHLKQNGGDASLSPSKQVATA